MMKYFFLLVVFLTVNKLFILNEESLVLLCFLVFVLVIIIKINHFVRNYLDNKINDLQESFETDINTIKSQIDLVSNSMNYLYNCTYLINKFKQYSKSKLKNIEERFIIFIMHTFKSLVFNQVSKFEQLEIEIYTLVKILIEIQLENIIKQLPNNNNIINSLINHEKIMLI
nr:Ymf39 [Cyanidioschyzonaceae sp. 1 FvB-2021]